MSGRRGDRRLDRLGRGRLRLAARLEELDLGGVDFGGLALMTILPFPGTRLEPPLEIDEAALLQVLPADFREVALADVPHDDVVLVGVLLLLAIVALAIAVRGEQESRH